MELSARFLSFVTSNDQLSNEVPEIQSDLYNIFDQQKIHHNRNGKEALKFWFLGMVISLASSFLNQFSVAT